MFFFNPTYLIFALPAMLLAMWAQYHVKSTFARYAQVPNMLGVSGAQVAQTLMQNEQLQYLQVNQVAGDLTDFYNPADKSINLSATSTGAPSVAAMAVVAHELGHAIQDRDGYTWMRLRSSIVGIANIGTNLGPMLFFIGILMGGYARGQGSIGWSIAFLGLLLFGGAVVFTLATLPVELNASRRAREMLMRNGLISREEMSGVSEMLNAAAWTYVAAAASAIANLLYYALILFGGGRRRD
ncbi:MAG: zinc metallopeptidase [Herpetosiphon sp.]